MNYIQSREQMWFHYKKKWCLRRIFLQFYSILAKKWIIRTWPWKTEKHSHKAKKHMFAKSPKKCNKRRMRFHPHVLLCLEDEWKTALMCLQRCAIRMKGVRFKRNKVFLSIDINAINPFAVTICHWKLMMFSRKFGHFSWIRYFQHVDYRFASTKYVFHLMKLIIVRRKLFIPS